MWLAANHQWSSIFQLMLFMYWNWIKFSPSGCFTCMWIVNLWSVAIVYMFSTMADHCHLKNCKCTMPITTVIKPNCTRDGRRASDHTPSTSPHLTSPHVRRKTCIVRLDGCRYTIGKQWFHTVSLTCIYMCLWTYCCLIFA